MGKLMFFANVPAEMSIKGVGARNHVGRDAISPTASLAICKRGASE